MDNKKDNSKLHLIYWIGMLSFALIVMIVCKFTEEPRFTEYIGNVATMTSLFLGVVAIFYSFISNSTLSSSLGNITSVSESLKTSEAKIGNVLDQSKILADNHDENIKNMRTMSHEVRSSVEALAETLQEISAKTGELQSTVHTFPSRLDAFGEVLEKMPLVQAAQADVRHGLTAKDARYFNASASVTANYITYACVLAKNSKKHLVINEVCALIDRNVPSFFSGFISCMSAARYIKRKSVKDQPGVWIISEIDNELEKDIKPYFLEYLEEVYKDDPAKKAEHLGKLNSLEFFYSESETTGDAST